MEKYCPKIVLNKEYIDQLWTSNKYAGVLRRK